jgi:hypothetical protein
MSRRRHTGLAAIHLMLAAALCAAWAPSAGAAESYAGTWECDAVPALNIPSVGVPGEATREGDRLTVSRVVHKPRSSEISGRASGTATVRDGKFVVETTGPENRFTGRYEGTVSDKAIALKGVESIRLPGQGDGERACRATLTRR